MMTVASVAQASLRPARSGADVRFAGMIAAIGVSFATVFLPLERLAFGSLVLEVGGLGVVGAPLAALLAWWLTPGVVKGSWRTAASVGVGVGVLAAYLGVVEVAYLALIEALAGRDPSTGFGSDIVGAVFIAMLGLPYGTFALPVTIPCGLAWAAIVRGVLRRVSGTTEIGPSSIGVRHVAIVLVLIAIGAGLVALGQSRVETMDGDWRAASSAIAGSR